MLDATKWEKPTPVTDVDLAFPARGAQLVPAFDDLPEEFRATSPGAGVRNHFGIAAALFFHYYVGRKIKEDALVFALREGQIQEDVERHLRVALGAYGNKHEHKIAGVAYLISRWMKLVGSE